MVIKEFGFGWLLTSAVMLRSAGSPGVPKVGMEISRAEVIAVVAGAASAALLLQLQLLKRCLGNDVHVERTLCQYIAS